MGSVVVRAMTCIEEVLGEMESGVWATVAEIVDLSSIPMTNREVGRLLAVATAKRLVARRPVSSAIFTSARWEYLRL